MIAWLIDWCGTNRLLVVLLSVLAGAWGMVELARTPLDAVPDLSDTQVVVAAAWPGRSPTQIEEQVTYPLSTLFLGAAKVKAVRGDSSFGQSFVTILFEDGTDLSWARSRVLEKLGAAGSTLPQGVVPQLGPDATGLGWVFQYAIVNDGEGQGGHGDPMKLRSLQDWTIRYALASVPGVAEVASVGGFRREYRIDLDPAKLLGRGVTAAEAAAAAWQATGDAGGGTFDAATASYAVRSHGAVRSADDLRQAVVGSDAPGRTILLGDLGTVGSGAAPRDGLADLDGRGEAVGGIVVMRSGENALRVIAGVKEKLAALAPTLPPGVKIVPVYDRSKLIVRAIATLRDKLIEESVVVSLVCLLFLWRFRSGLVAILVLPLAVLLSFIPFHHLGLTANILSLGGIAIAIGAMVDAALVMVENAHRHLERAPEGSDRTATILASAREVGRPLFFSLLVITVSFLPIFALPEQSGRLFSPLATTKTFAMAFAALLSVTLVPALMVWFLRGPIPPEERNPLNRFLARLYAPAVDFVLRRPRTMLGGAALLLAATAFPLLRLGTEFMPPLDEGDLLFMPTAVPGLAAGEAARILRRQDAALKAFPEVETVFGKAGRADTATDPAPLSMFETTIQLKPRAAWRPGMTREKLVAAMDRATRTPGMANVFWMPVQTRTEMLATGFRSRLGLKVYGPDLETIDRAAAGIARALAGMPGTRSVFAERAEGGRYLDVDPDRRALARDGIALAQVNEALETALGADPVATVAEGRERVPVRVAYAPDFRQSLPALEEILVPAPGGAQVPLKSVARLSFQGGPPEIRSEGGRLAEFVSIDPEGDDIAAYVRDASRRIADQAALPEGISLEWTGTYRQLQLATERLRVVVPLTLLVIFILIYANTRSVARTGLVFLAVPFSLIGAFWLLWLLGYHLSVAVWVGLIALAGIDAETGVVMLLYLDQARAERVTQGRLRNRADLLAAIREGAVRRLRPKAMTVCAILFGLLPILWGDGTGSDVMKRVAAPMVGGVVSSGLLELLLYPAVYLLWQGRSLRPGPGSPEPETADIDS